MPSEPKTRRGLELCGTGAKPGPSREMEAQRIRSPFDVANSAHEVELLKNCDSLDHCGVQAEHKKQSGCGRSNTWTLTGMHFLFFQGL